jgi:hypothetical protein
MKAKNILLGVLSILILTGGDSACGLAFLQPATATPTDTPPPTATLTLRLTATATALPTETPTPTETPNLAATQAALNEQTVREKLAALKLPADTGHLGWYQQERLTIGLQGQAAKWETFAEDLNAGDFVMYAEATWKTDSWPTCGLLFRSDDRLGKGDTYALQFLRFSGLPAWDIEYYRDGLLISLITNDIKFSDYLDIDDGATNRFLLAATGNEFKLYLNDNYEGQYYDWSKKLSEGKIAFLATQLAGSTKCIFENSWVWVYK